MLLGLKEFYGLFWKLARFPMLVAIPSVIEFGLLNAGAITPNYRVSFYSLYPLHPLIAVVNLQNVILPITDAVLACCGVNGRSESARDSHYCILYGVSVINVLRCGCLVYVTAAHTDYSIHKFLDI